jgi:hypothetical protein
VLLPVARGGGGAEFEIIRLISAEDEQFIDHVEFFIAGNGTAGRWKSSTGSTRVQTMQATSSVSRFYHFGVGLWSLLIHASEAHGRVNHLHEM